MYKNILVATDGSADAVRAAEAAAEIAASFGSQVTLLAVYSVPVMLAPETTFVELDQETMRETLDNVLRRTAAPLVQRNVKFETRTEVGNPAAMIVNVAESIKADLLVVGSHGVGGLRRFLLGSVSDRVGHYAHCTVMIVKRGH